MKTLLATTDFSVPAQNAVEYAADLAREFNADLIILNVNNFAMPAYDTLPTTEMMQEAERESMEGLERIRRKIEEDKGIKGIITISRAGTARGVIEAVAKEYKADAIVMGITGQAGKIKEKIIGSTALEMARELTTPLFIIPEGAQYRKVKKLSFACDIDNLKGSRVLESIKDFCAKFGATLEIVNIEKPAVEEDPIRTRNYRFMESNLEDVAHETVIVTEEDSHEALLAYFENHHPDLLAVNPKKQNSIQSLFHKSMTKSLAFHGKAPLLVVH